MTGFILNWNQVDGFDWTTLASDAATTREGRSVLTPQWVGQQTGIALGDRVFIIALGKKPKGMIASGYAAPVPEGKVAVRDGSVVYLHSGFREGRYITARVDVVLTLEEMLPLERLEETDQVSSLVWRSVQMPGGRIKPSKKSGLGDLDIMPALEALWKSHLASIGFDLPSSNEDETSGFVLFGREGMQRVRTHWERERDSRLVEAKKTEAMRHHGKLECEVCNLVFSERYGAHGMGFIECHHREPLARVDPQDGRRTELADLALVCANCHRMLHWKSWPTVEDLRSLLKAARMGRSPIDSYF